MAEVNEIKVLSCDVRYETGEDGVERPVFHGTKVLIKGTVRKMLGDKVLHSENVSWTCLLDGVPVEDALVPFGATVRIKMAVIRDLSLDDFKATAKRLNGSEVAYNDIGEWTGKGERAPRKPLLVQQLIATGRFDEAAARAIYDDPERRVKAQAMIDALLKSASLDDL